MRQAIMVLVLSALILLPTVVPAGANYLGQTTRVPGALPLSFMGNPTQNLDLSVGLKVGYTTQVMGYLYGNEDNCYLTMLGPSALVTYRDMVYADLNYFKGAGKGDFTEVDKTDIDLRAGFLFHPRIAAYVGYKTIKFDFDVYSAGRREWTFKGPALGLDVNFPLFDTGMVLFGALQYGFLSYDISGVSYGREETAMYSFEAGLAYSLQSLPGLSLALGANYQSYDNAFYYDYDAYLKDLMEKDGLVPMPKKTNGKLYNYGITLDVNYRF